MFKRILQLFLLVVVGLILFAGVYIAFNYKSDLPLSLLKDKYAFEDSKFLEIDGMEVHYRKNGKGHPLVLVHGFGGNLWNWQHWQTLLQDSFQVVSLDLPGFGFTGPRPDGNYSTAAYIDFLDRFLNEIELDTFYLAGNSMGGGFAWQYTIQYPKKVKKLILVNASGYPREHSGGTITGFKILDLPLVNQLVTKVTPRSILRQTVSGVYGDQSLVTEEKVDFYLDIMRRPGNRKALLDRRKADRGLGYEQIQRIKTPTLIIWGDQDLLIDYKNAYKFEKDIKGSEVIVYKGVGHIPMMEIPEQSANDLRSFLSKD